MNMRKYNKVYLFALISIISIIFAAFTGCADNRDILNFSEDYSDAVVYHLTADHLDLEALNTYPQKIKKINSEKPYDIELYVENRTYFNIEGVPYKKYSYDDVISQYLEATETIQTDSELVSKTADSFLYKDATVQGIVGKALDWNTQNIEYDKPLAKLVAMGTNKTRSAENTIKLGKGACTEYANVFIAFMRHLGIPARYVFGYHQVPNPTYHAWAEFYLKGYGWIPVESQLGGFGVPDSYIKLFVGKDLIDLDIIKIYAINAHYEVIK